MLEALLLLTNFESVSSSSPKPVALGTWQQVATAADFIPYQILALNLLNNASIYYLIARRVLALDYVQAPVAGFRS